MEENYFVYRDNFRRNKTLKTFEGNIFEFAIKINCILLESFCDRDCGLFGFYSVGVQLVLLEYIVDTAGEIIYRAGVRYIQKI